MTFEYFCGLVSDIAHVPADIVRENSSFRDDLGIDSLQMVNLLTQLSSLFHAGMEAFETPEDLLTVGNLYRALSRGGNQ